MEEEEAYETGTGRGQQVSLKLPNRHILKHPRGCECLRKTVWASKGCEDMLYVYEGYHLSFS